MTGSSGGYQFTNNWFETTAKNIWQQLIPKIKPQKVLEIGSYEGASAAFLIEKNDWCEEIVLWCIDTWDGGIEHRDASIDMTAVEKRFDHNIALAEERAQNKALIYKAKGFSDTELSKLIAGGHAGTFDFVYVDGSHQAPDVLTDAVLAFKLCKLGSIIAFDDYLWAEELEYGRDPIRCPKFAVDAFTNIFFRKVQILNVPLSQLWVRKIAD